MHIHAPKWDFGGVFDPINGSNENKIPSAHVSDFALNDVSIDLRRKGREVQERRTTHPMGPGLICYARTAPGRMMSYSCVPNLFKYL